MQTTPAEYRPFTMSVIFDRIGNAHGEFRITIPAGVQAADLERLIRAWASHFLPSWFPGSDGYPIDITETTVYLGGGMLGIGHIVTPFEDSDDGE